MVQSSRNWSSYSKDIIVNTSKYNFSSTLIFAGHSVGLLTSEEAVVSILDRILLAHTVFTCTFSPAKFSTAVCLIDISFFLLVCN